MAAVSAIGLSLLTLLQSTATDECRLTRPIPNKAATIHLLAFASRSLSESNRNSVLRSAAAVEGKSSSDDDPKQSYINIYFDSTNDGHKDRTYHPESPARIDACIKQLCDDEKLSSGCCGIGASLRLCDVADEPRDNLPSGTATIAQRPFSLSELAHARDMLVLAHSEEYVLNIERRCKLARQKRIDEGKDPLGFIGYMDDGGDTYLTTESYNVLLRATASWIRAADDMLLTKGKLGGGAISSAMALTRPPGHHAEKSTANGFCIFNFAAAAAIHAAQGTSDNHRKVSILDFDVHYGQGISDILQHYDSCRYASLHQYPAFPYLGFKREVTGKHKNVLTVPLPPESSWTCGYRLPFEERILPFLCQEGVWEPDLIIVCAGYDALSSDELASCDLCAADYGRMVRLLREHVRQEVGTKITPSIVVGLEGGYQLKEGSAGGNLQEALMHTLRELV